jgi:D-alanyl-lipoteichoic acid acyltransferase DltB (MBOAT superfamily)
VVAGARRVVWGLFQKTVVADRLAPFVGAAFSDVRHHAGLPLLVATYLYSAQLYFDFAGYTDMALGLGRALGIRLTPNFAAPYLARSVSEFWRRWHISLSSWLLDYVFRPLQLGLRGWRTWGTPAALVITFLVSGLWHGASWTFVAWGLLHGLYLAASVLYRPVQRRLHRALGLDGSPVLAVAQIAVTFHLVCLGWIFFRAGSLRDALEAVRLLASELPRTTARAATGHDVEALVFLGQGRGAFLAAVAAIVAGIALRPLLGHARAAAAVPEEEGASPVGLASSYARTAAYAVLVYGVVALGTSAQSFLYAQF